MSLFAEKPKPVDVQLYDDGTLPLSRSSQTPTGNSSRRSNKPPPMGAGFSDQELASGHCFRQSGKEIVHLEICHVCKCGFRCEDHRLYYSTKWETKHGACLDCLHKVRQMRPTAMGDAVLDKIGPRGNTAANVASLCRLSKPEAEQELYRLRAAGRVHRKGPLWFRNEPE